MMEYKGYLASTIQLSPEEHRRVILAATKAGKRVDSWVADVLEQAAQV